MTIANLKFNDDNFNIIIKTDKTQKEVRKIFHKEVEEFEGKHGEGSWCYEDIIQSLEEKGLIVRADQIEENYYINI